MEEPFRNLFNQGMITRLVEKTGRIEKMSKSKGNTVSPDPLIDEMGRTPSASIPCSSGPPEDEVEWNDEAKLVATGSCSGSGVAERGRTGDALPTAPADGEPGRLRHDDPEGDEGLRASQVQ
ncbi:MAG: hypothetical protein R2862_05270 [Thermoanaerobaculia bacterium]